MRKLLNPIYLFILLFAGSYLFSQQSSSSAVINAIGGSAVSSARGIDAIHCNPANIGLYNRTNWEISFLPRVQIDVNNSVFNYGAYLDYFTGDGTGNPKILNENDKNNLLSLFNDNDAAKIFSSVSAEILSVTANYREIYGGFAASIRERGLSHSLLPKDAFQLMLFGNSLNRNYNFDNLKGSGYWFREYSLGYGFQFLRSGSSMAALGLNVKYLSGNAIYSFYDTEAGFVTTDTSLNGKMKFKALYSYNDYFENENSYEMFSSAGEGQSFDVGITYIPNNIITISAAVLDLGYIIWKKNVYEIDIDTSGIIKNITDENEYKPFEDIIKRHKNKILKVTTNLPLTINAGVTINLDKTGYFRDINSIPISLSFEYSMMLKSQYILPESIHRYSIGLSLLPVKWLPIRAGYTFGYLPGRFSFGTGLNFHNFDVDVAFGNLPALFLSRSAKSFQFSLSTRLLF